LKNLQALLPAIRTLHERIRDAVVDSCERLASEELARIAREQEGDTIYAIDRVSEELIVDFFEREIAPQASLVLIAEGLEGGQIVLPRGTSEESAFWRIIVDPIDGTVNFAYGIPHACVSIALQGKASADKPSVYPDGYQTLVGVVYDPFVNELWAASLGRPARLNGRAISVSKRTRLEECLISIGFAKSKEMLEKTLPYFNEVAHRVRKIRMMGAAALALSYVATGRFDAYIEQGIRLWDVAAGGFILECAGGEFWRQPIDSQHGYRMIATPDLLNAIQALYQLSYDPIQSAGNVKRWFDLSKPFW